MVFLTEGNMKKQFFRVKQLADQTFARAEKTTLNDDLVNKEKRVELLKKVCVNTTNKLQGCLQGQGSDGPAIEKRLRKYAENQLGASMCESSAALGENTMLSSVLDLMGRLETDLSRHLLCYELDAEKMTLIKFMDLLENDIPALTKLRKQLKTLTIDYDSLRNRYQQENNRHPGQVPNTAKIDSLKDEVEDAYMKVDQCRNNLASEFYNLLSKEAMLSTSLLQLATCQRDYHRKALEDLEKAIPTISAAIASNNSRPVYGCPLEDHLTSSGRKIALPIDICVNCLLDCGTEEEGLFRIASGASKVKKLKASFDAGELDLKEYDPHSIAGVLKQYLRELPEPLMTTLLYEEWMDASRKGDLESVLKAMWHVVNQLPKANYDNLRYLIKFLSLLAKQQDVNKMSTQNIAIVIAPNLIWEPEGESSPLTMTMGLANAHSSIVDNLITYADYFFPGDEDFQFVPSTPRPQDECAGGSPPPASLELDDEEAGGQQQQQPPNQLLDAANNVGFVAEGRSSIGGSSGSPKSGSSPKPARKTKKPAPPVPLPPKDRASAPAGGYPPDVVTTSHSEKPQVADKPRPTHERTPSAVSLDSIKSLGSSETGESVSPVQSSPVPASATSAVAGANGRSFAGDERPKLAPRVANSHQRTMSADAKAMALDRAHVFSADRQQQQQQQSMASVAAAAVLSVAGRPKPLDLSADGAATGDSAISTSVSPTPDHQTANQRGSALSSHPAHAPSTRPTKAGPEPQSDPRQDEPNRTGHHHHHHVDKLDRSVIQSMNLGLSKMLAGDTQQLKSPTEPPLSPTADIRHHPATVPPVSDAVKSLRHCTLSLDRKLRQPPYVNVPNITGDPAAAVDDGVGRTSKSTEEISAVGGAGGDAWWTRRQTDDDDSREGSQPPERPAKYDKTKVVPPMRPEKSDRLRAMLDAGGGDHQIRTPAKKSAKSDRSSLMASLVGAHHGPSKVAEKPTRPSYSPAAAKGVAKAPPVTTASSTNPAPCERLYPSLSNLLNDDFPEQPLPRSQPNFVVPPSVAPSSPGGPRRPPRPQPRPPLPPVAKPRTTVLPAAEQTHL